MAAQHTLHVALTKPLVNFVDEQIATGHYATASEVVRAALRLLIERSNIDGAKPAKGGHNTHG